MLLLTLQSNTALLAAAFSWAEALETVRHPDLGSTSSDLSEKARDPSKGVRRSFMAHFRVSPGRFMCAVLAALYHFHSLSWDIHNSITKDKLLSLSVCDHNTETQGRKESMWTMSVLIRPLPILLCSAKKLAAVRHWRCVLESAAQTARPRSANNESFVMFPI